MPYKIYKRGGYFYIVDTATNREREGLTKDVKVSRGETVDTDFYFKNVNNWDASQAVNITEMKDHEGVAYTLSSFISFYEGASLVSTTDPHTQIALGNVQGQRIFRAMGERESMGTTVTGEDIWRGTATTIPMPGVAGEQMTLVSSNDADNGATATGVLSVEIHYLDDTGAEQIEVISLDGTTPVHTVATNMRFINDLHTKTVGSNGVAEGDIIIYKFGAATTIYNLISIGGNKSLVPNRMVPIGKKLILKAWHAEEAQSKRVNFRIRSTDIDGELLQGVFLFKDVAYLKQSTSPQNSLNVLVPALSIVKVSGWSSLAGAEGSCGWWGILVDD